jgi:hypothetical protein
MAVSKKPGREEMVRDLFLALAAKWDVHDKPGAKNLTKSCLEAVDGFYEVMDQVYTAKKPEKLEKPEKLAKPV